MAQDSAQIRVALAGHVYVAPFGTTLPDDETAGSLDAAFVDLGYTTDDGVTVTAGVNVEDINSWQKATPTRKIVTARSIAAAFNLQQWNPDTFALAFGGGDWDEPSPGTVRYRPPADSDPLVEYAVVVDFADGDIHSRFVVFKATVTEDVETQLVRSAAAELPVTLSGLTPDDQVRAWEFFSDDPDFEGFPS